MGSVPFGILLKRYRTAAGLTQEELAARAGLSSRGISDLERGERKRPHPDTRERLARALELALYDRELFLSEPGGGSSGAALAPVGRFLGALSIEPLVGRGEEFARAVGFVEAERDGASRLVLLTGEPGVGKTRLAQELAVDLWQRGFLVVTGRCYEAEQLAPFYPFLEVLTLTLRIASVSLQAEIATHWPSLGRLLPELQISVPLSADREEERERLLRAVVDYLHALAGARPLAILLDDLQWADESSLRLLQQLARYRGEARILLAGTYRDNEVDPTHRLARAVLDLQREGLVERISLPCLDGTGTLELVRSTVGPVSREVSSWIHARTDGNPFFSLQLAQALLEQGRLSTRRDRWSGLHLEQAEVPESVREVIGGRVARLSGETQHMIRQASVLGQVFGFEDLAAMADAPRERVEETLGEATTTGLIRKVSREQFGFNHSLTQQAVYAALPEHQRRRFHRAAGRALEGLRDEMRTPRAAELARHFREGDDPKRALLYSLMAGDAAEAVFAHFEAEEHYFSAREFAHNLELETEEADALERLGGVFLLTGRYDEARNVLERAAEIYRASGNLERLGHVTAQIGMVYMMAGWKGIETVARLRSMVESLEAGPPSPALVEIYVQLATLLFLDGRYPEQLAAAERALDQVSLLQNHPLHPQAQFYRGLAFCLLGRLDQGMSDLSLGVRMAENRQDRSTQCELHGGLGVMHLLWGALQESRFHLERAVELAEQLGNPWQICLWEGCVGLWAFIVGEWPEADRRFERALTSGEHSRLPYPLWQRGWMELATGAWDQAALLLERCIAMVGENGDLQALRWASGLMAELDLQHGRHEVAHQRLMSLLDRPDLKELNVTFLLPRLACALTGMGDATQAQALAAEAVERARSQHFHLALVDALRVQGVMMAADRRWGQAESLFEEAVSLAKSMPYPYAEARTLFEWGKALAQRGDPEGAREFLQPALVTFHRLGASPYAVWTEQMLNDSTPKH